jgi:tRNA-Thr(GGU) m(6)t(6)A37 methyltransferase TsaA
MHGRRWHASLVTHGTDRHRATVTEFLFRPIGIVRSPFEERAAVPRQASTGAGIAARIELDAGHGYEDALSGLDAWEYAWVLFVFHKNVEQERGWRPKVLPPRATEKHGVFATRSPHRPNPIGMSAVRIERVDGLVVHVRDIDLLDGTPVLDIKPYVAYADSRPDARAGWLEAADPRAAWTVEFSERARAQLAWLRDQGVDLGPPIEAALALGPQPHAYRRIRRHGAGMRLSVKDWRADFDVLHERRILVRCLQSGYKAAQLAADASLSLHRAFAVAFAAPFAIEP